VSIRNANTSLGDALSLLSAQSTKAGIEQQLTAIEGSVAKIRQWLKKNG
jgi:septation ring formation regulator EzrA